MTIDQAEPFVWIVMGSVALIVAIVCARWQDKERRFLMDKIVKQRDEIKVLSKATISVFLRGDGVTALRLEDDLLVGSKKYGRVVIPRGFIFDGYTIPRGPWFSNHFDKQWTVGCILSDYLDASKKKGTSK